jgi:hypothetical protein
LARNLNGGSIPYIFPSASAVAFLFLAEERRGQRTTSSVPYSPRWRAFFLAACFALT